MLGNSIITTQQDGLDLLAKHARGVLVLIAGVQLGLAALFWFAGDAPQKALIVPVLCAAVIYGALALWARRAPLPAVLVGFAIFLGDIGLGLAQGGSIFDGILFRVILLALFLNGIGSARQYNEAKKRVEQQAAKG